jgi:hypothetical protein
MLSVAPALANIAGAAAAALSGAFATDESVRGFSLDEQPIHVNAATTTTHDIARDDS